MGHGQNSPTVERHSCRYDWDDGYTTPLGSRGGSTRWSDGKEGVGDSRGLRILVDDSFPSLHPRRHGAPVTRQTDVLVVTTGRLGDRTPRQTSSRQNPYRNGELTPVTKDMYGGSTRSMVRQYILPSLPRQKSLELLDLSSNVPPDDR